MGVGGGEMQIHDFATCDAHLDFGEVCRNPEHGERCRISGRHKLARDVHIVRLYGACGGCLG